MVVSRSARCRVTAFVVFVVFCFLVFFLRLRRPPSSPLFPDAPLFRPKPHRRDYAGARDQIRRSLERLRIDQLDLIQFHSLREREDRDRVFSEDGALRAAVELRDEGLVRFIGVTGHGLSIPDAHLDSLERFQIGRAHV